MRALLVATAVVAVLVASPARAEEHPRSKRGGRCAAASQCETDLRCVQRVCVDEATYARSLDKEPVSTQTYGYIGGVLGAILPALANGSFGEGAQLAVRLGIVIDSLIELKLEVAPATTVIGGLTSSAFAVFDVNGSVGVLPRISDMVSWIVRVGGGGGAILCDACSSSTSTGTRGVAAFGFGELRLDVFGVEIRTSRNLMIDINTPSFRVLFLPGGSSTFGNVMLAWVTSVGVNYVF